MTDRLALAIAALTHGPETGPTILCAGCHQPKAPDAYHPSDVRNGTRRCRTCRNRRTSP